MSSNLTPEEIQQIVSVLDCALQSDAPTVVSALQNLVLVASLAADSKNKTGPLQSMLNRIDSLQRDVDRLMHEVERTRRYMESLQQDNYNNRKKHNPYDTYIGGTTPTWAVYDEWDTKYRDNSNRIKDILKDFPMKQVKK